MRKPKIFIGSSKEALDFARAIKPKLQDIAAVTVWDENVFNPGRATLESLIELLPMFDFAVLILSSDDLTASRGVISQVPRDNIIFELGLFMGHLGRFRTFFICSEGVDIPSDLAGITYIPFEARRGDESSAVSDACKIIRREIKRQEALKLFQSAAIISRIKMASWKEIYARAARLVKQAEARVRATSFGIPSRLQGEELEYFESIAERAAEQKERRAGFIYKAVCSKGATAPERNIGLRDRKEIFDRYHVSDCLHAREIEGAWGVDLLIVDESHLHVSFHHLGNHSLGLGLELTYAEELVRPIASWYEECLFNQATPIDWDNLQ